jgi:hypothetical protein
MKVLMKTNIKKNGDVCICIIDNEFHANNEEIPLVVKNTIRQDSIKPKKYYNVANIGIELEKDNYIPIQYKDKVLNEIDQIKHDLKSNGVKIVQEEQDISYKYSPIIKPKRDSCEPCKKMFGCL